MAHLIDYDEDIDVNEFFIQLQAQTILFQDTTSKQYTICVPRQGSFDVKSLSLDVLQTHILKSRLDHDIKSTIKTVNDKEVRLANGNVETISGFQYNKKVRVLFEVDYINEEEKQYKVLCVDRPLEGDNWAGINEPFSVRLSTMEQCMDFLWNGRKTKLKRRVDLLVAPTINNLQHTSNQEEVAGLCKTLYERGLNELLRDPTVRRNAKANYFFYEAMQVALETYLMGLVHDSVFTKLYNLHREQEVEFNKTYLALSEITPEQLHLEPKHCVNVPRARIELDSLVRCHSPLEMSNCLDRAITLLSHSPSRSRHNRPSTPPDETTESVVLSTDELVPLIILLVVGSSIPCWLTIISYLTHFTLAGVVSSRVSYAVTSFNAAVLYIKSGQLSKEILSDERALDEADSETESSALQRLFHHIRHGSKEEMKRLLDTAGDRIIETLCHPLCSCDRCELIKQKKQSDKEVVTVLSQDERGWTALHAAAYYGNREAVELLVFQDYPVWGKAAGDGGGRLPLHMAADQGHQHIAMLLIYYNSPVNATDDEGNSPLHIACLRGHFHVVTAMLYQAGSEPININCQNVREETPLLLAAKFGYYDIVSELLENGADVSIENKTGEGPIQVALDNEIRTLLISSAKPGSKVEANPIHDRLEALTAESTTESGSSPTRSSVGSFDFGSNGAAADSSMWMNGSVSIGRANVMSGALGGALKMTKSQSLVTFSALRDTLYSNGQLFNHHAEEVFNRKLKQLFASVRANDVNEVTRLLGGSSTHTLCHPKCHCSKCEELRQEAVSPTFAYSLTVNSQDDVMSGGMTSLHVAAEMGLAEMCVCLLNLGASVNTTASPSLNTPLHMAAMNNHAEIVSVLFQYGANGDLQNREGDTALHLAASNGHVWPISVIASVAQVNINLTNHEGNTPLHLAVINSHLKAAKTLIKSSCITDITNNKDQTPLQIAGSVGDPELCDLLARDGGGGDSPRAKFTLDLSGSFQEDQAKTLESEPSSSHELTVQDGAAENGDAEHSLENSFVSRRTTICASRDDEDENSSSIDSQN